jgi:hypothetical protein
MIGSVSSANDSVPHSDAAVHSFSADLRPQADNRIVALLKMTGTAVEQLITQGETPPASGSDLVISRRSDGSEVVRISAGDRVEAGNLLASARAQLEKQSSEQFLKSWGVTSPEG